MIDAVDLRIGLYAFGDFLARVQYVMVCGCLVTTDNVTFQTDACILAAGRVGRREGYDGR